LIFFSAEIQLLSIVSNWSKAV